MNRRNRSGLAAIGLTTLAFSVFLSGMGAVAADRFAGELDPCPEDNSTRAAMVGTGDISATLAGSTLIVEGRFAGFSSLAIAAHLNQGTAMGVPGPMIGALEVQHALNGNVSGKLALSKAEIAALKTGALYVQIDSKKAPKGNSWAWLETAP